MPNRVHVLAVSEAERAELERRIRERGALARDVARARIVLLSSQGLTGPEIAERVGCSEPTVVLWRRRFAQQGLAWIFRRGDGLDPELHPCDFDQGFLFLGRVRVRLSRRWRRVPPSGAVVLS